ncbi:hypothetical protein V5O48_006951 [Marasmius crinis-equi]|uniref:Carbohydrate esterase family 16 protein n=1 Tax=Marasmius crinis-equi TaxID=585013 RepID=A0ABR3FI29_9AGAR
MFSLVSSLLFACTATAAVLPSRDEPVKLAVAPKCGELFGAYADINAGLNPLSYYKDIVAFGDSYTSGSVIDGSPLPPPVMSPPNPNAGGRVSNGQLWVENLASTAGATLHDYAVNGSVVDASQYPGSVIPNARDLVKSIDYYILNGERTNPETTLYVIFVGMGDYEFRDQLYNKDLTSVAGSVLYRIMQLNSAPTFARNFLVVDNYGRGEKTSEGEAYKQQLFDSIGTLRSSPRYGTNVAFVDFSTLWNGALSNPGAFGYTNTGACTLNDKTTDGACADPDHTFYWIPGNPSKATHGLMAQYVEKVLNECKA